MTKYSLLPLRAFGALGGAVLWLCAASGGIPGSAVAAPVSITLPWEKSWPVVTPATAGSFGVVLKNTGGEPAEVAFTATFVSPAKKEEAVVKQTVSLAAGEERRVAWPLTGKEFGAWSVTYSATQAKDPRSNISRKVRFGYFEPVGADRTRPAFMLGIVAHAERLPKPERDQQLEAAALIGCKVLRSNPGWEKIQPARDKWNWEVMDDMLAATEALGMEMQVVLAYTTKWAAPPEKQSDKSWLAWNRAMPDLDAWRTFVGTYGQRYKGRVRLWETWNEPDLDGFFTGSTDDYISMLRVSIEELRKADPANGVMSGGFATLRHHAGRKLNPDLQERTMQALGTQLSYHAVHEHSVFKEFAKTVDGPHARLRGALPQPVPPLYFNETAIHSMSIGEEEQARTLVKKVSFVRSRGAVGYSWYDLRDDGEDPAEPEHHFGLLTYHMEPKPAYIAFNTFARLAARTPFVRQIEAGQNRWFMEFGEADEKVLVFWNDDQGAQDEQIMLRIPGLKSPDAARIVDIYGNSSPAMASGELVVITANKEPRYLLLPGARGVEHVGRLAGPSRAYYGGPGEEMEIGCDFANPTSAPVQVEVAWDLPRLLSQATAPAAPSSASSSSSASQPQTLTIPAGGTKAARLKVRLPQGADYAFGTASRVRVRYEFKGMPYKGAILVPIHFGTVVVPSGNSVAGEGRAADIVLISRDQVFSFIDNDPNMAMHRWKGPDDLSARVW
ncbi:MAG TPA: hypothetical protein VK970_21930, partial [Candidatus Methylacidiphilales bacterium]|nr:hypothetical protein [Candidatus Methylacidiphilales bacterium]